MLEVWARDPGRKQWVTGLVLPTTSSQVEYAPLDARCFRLAIRGRPEGGGRVGAVGEHPTDNAQALRRSPGPCGGRRGRGGAGNGGRKRGARCSF